jgi:hypothetical protein
MRNQPIENNNLSHRFQIIAVKLISKLHFRNQVFTKIKNNYKKIKLRFKNNSETGKLIQIYFNLITRIN